MKIRQIAWRALLLAVFACALTSQARAQATVTYVSATGDDANPCSRTAPCKTFTSAVSKTAAHGEVDVLDAGGFGSVTIVKSVTINGRGTAAHILNVGINGVTVNAATTDVVILRNIAIDGAGAGLDGIRVLSAKTVQVDNCWIYGQGGDAIEVAATNNVNLKVDDTTIEDCEGDGIHVSTTSGQALVSVDNARIQDCTDGVEAVSNVRAAIRNSVLTHNASIGIQTSGSNSQLNIENVIVSYGTVGLQASAGSNIRVSNSVIAQNSTGISANGGMVDSFQGNSLMGNTVNGSFTTTTVKQ